MEGNVSIELLEERYPIADQDRQDRITHLVSQPKAKAFAGNGAASNKPDATESGPQVLVHELRKIAGVELDGFTGSRQVATSEDEGRFVTVRPTNPLGLKIQRGLIGS